MRHGQVAAAVIAVTFAASLAICPKPAAAEEAMWVTAADGAARHTCPSPNCGIVGRLFYREGATVLEEKNGWGRISPQYDASCVGGRSEYVDHGRADCVPENGIEDGRLAEWIQLSYLSAQRPADRTGVARLVAQSDDFYRYEAEFVRAAEALIASGECTPRDFTDMGGWVKAMSPGIYFTYCGGGSDRIYLDVSTEKTFR